MKLTVGQAFETAQKRCDELRESTPRRVRVRLFPSHPTSPSGVLISVTMKTETSPELAALLDANKRVIPWADLEADPATLIAHVNEAAAAAEAAVEAATAPAPTPATLSDPSRLDAMPASERATLESMAARVRDQAINQGHELAGSGAEGIAPDEYYFALAMAAIEAAAVFGRRGGMDASWLRSELSRSLLKVEEDERERAKADCEVLFRKASRSRKALN